MASNPLTLACYSKTDLSIERDLKTGLETSTQVQYTKREKMTNDKDDIYSQVTPQTITTAHATKIIQVESFTN